MIDLKIVAGGYVDMPALFEICYDYVYMRYTL